MFWADRLGKNITARFGEKVAAGTPLVIRDEWTASGHAHVGALRGVVIHGIIGEVLSELGVANEFTYEINDFDPLDGLPLHLDKETFAQYMGRPLNTVPSPNGTASNYAEYFAREFIGVIDELGFTPRYYRSSELYARGAYNDAIRTALEHAAEIREIYERVSGSKRRADWLPISMVCEKCGKIGTTRPTGFDGEKVSYVCEPSFVAWAEGCGHEGAGSPFNGSAKLPWKVEWAAKFMILDVAVEGAGKDHSTKGGSRDIADAISREVFNREPPFDIPYEFFLVEGKKMASSKGLGATARSILDALPYVLVRLLVLSKEPRQSVEFSPRGDTIPVLYDLHDKLAEKYHRGVRDDHVRSFTLSHSPRMRENIPEPFLLRFSQVVFIAQMPHMILEEEAAKLKGSPLSELERAILESRREKALRWVKENAPEEFKFELQTGALPEAARAFSDAQREALRKVLSYAEAHDPLDGQALHARLHEIRKESGLSAEEFFGALYIAFLGKPNGPKAGWFLSSLERPFLLRRFSEAAEGRE